MPGVTWGPANFARVAARVGTKASPLGAGPMTQSVRAFRAVPDMARLDRVRIGPSSPNGKDFGAELLRARGPALLGIASKAESTRTFTYGQIHSDPAKWKAFVKNINVELLKPDSPFRTMSGEEALALMMTLEEAGHACDADLKGFEFAALVLNLPQLAHLSFTPDDRLQIGAFARSVVDAAAGIMPATGMDFINKPENDRKLLLQALMDKSLACLEAAGMGLAEADKNALRNIDFSTTVPNPFGGGFTVIPGSDPNDEAEGSLMLSPSLLLPTEELTSLLEKMATEQGVSVGDIANRLMATLIGTVAHELRHLFEYSQISGPDIDKHSEYLRAQTNQFSLAVERLHNLGYQDSAKKFVLFHHEQAAWYTTHMIRAAIAESPKMDNGVQEAADAMETDPRDFLMLEVLLGNKPPAVAIVNDLGITSAESSCKPADVLRATPRLARDELNRVAPLMQEDPPATGAIKV